MIQNGKSLTPQDTLLNVFLAIAVDNLTNAQEMTAAEEEEEVGRKEVPVCLGINFILKIIFVGLI